MGTKFEKIKKVVPITAVLLKEIRKMETYDLTKYVVAHQHYYATALWEVRNGRKESHWIWFIFPQLKGLGVSGTSEYYGIRNLDEAKAFLQDEYLGGHLVEITTALLSLKTDDIKNVMDFPDDMKLRSSMTLFSLAAPEKEIFQKVLEKFYEGKSDDKTIEILNR